MSSRLTYLESLRQALHTALEEDPLALVLGEDILDPYGGAFKVTKGLSSKFPNRVISTPICEGSIMGVATGLALRGLHPIVELMFGDFITLAADQLINHAAKYAGMYGQDVTMPLVLRTPMGGGRGYGPTHSQSLEKLFFGIPNLTILSPSHYHAAGDVLRNSIGKPGPFLFIENKLLYPQALQIESNRIQRSTQGNAAYPCIILRNFSPPKQADLTIIAYGGMSRLLEPVLERLKQDEIHVVVCLPAQVSPLDPAPLLEGVRESGRVVVIEESGVEFGWGAQVSSVIYDELHGKLAAPIKRVGAAQTVVPAGKTLEAQVLVSEEKIWNAVLEVMQW